MAHSPGPQEINRLLTLLNQGRYVEAETLARAITSRFPQWGTGWTALGIALKQMGRIADALTPMQKAAKLLPGLAETHSNLSTVLQDLGMVTEAEAGCRRALAIKPEFAEAHNNLGVSLLDQGRLDEAEASFRSALKYRSDFAAAHFNLHALLLDREGKAPALACLERAVEIDPSSQERRFALGMLLDYTGDAGRAQAHFETIKNGSAASQSKLDAWRYLKSAGHPLPSITGTNVQALKLGIELAAIEGLVLEFGVRFGTSLRHIAAMARQEVHGFDSFEGIPEQWHDEPQGNYSTRGVLPEVPDNVRLHAGWFEDTLPEFLKSHPGPVRFMNVDCDIYSSTKTVLDLLADRIISGTVIAFDEYIGNEHWREDEFKAFQEAVVRHGWTYRYVSFSFFTKQVLVQIL